MNHNLNKQSGHAAILFALFIPVLFGVFTLGTDGARAIQDKARLLEAVEVASLAVAGQGSDDKTLAKSYVQYYFPLAKIEDKDIEIQKLNCEDNQNCRDQERRFFEYRVTASITQPTWFPGNEAIIGFGKNYQVSDASITRKYHSETVDVVLVADFSASMYEFWDGGSKRKFLDLKDIISDISTELETFNGYNVNSEKRNKLAVVGFDFYTSRVVNNTRTYYDHLTCWVWNRQWVEGRCKSDYPGDDHRYVNAEATIRDVFNLNSNAHNPVAGSITNISIFEDVNLTDNMSFIRSKIKSNSFNIMRSTGSGTSSYAGIIRGAQMALAGNNPRRLIILLSDGQDSYWRTTDKLINPASPGFPPSSPTALGLCNRILNELNNQKTVEGDDVTARMVAVGFDYNINAFPQMRNCVGQENVFSAENRNDIKNKILELITEEIGHLAR
ncbi:TadG [Vibrio sp. V30_P3S12P165]|uniref:TadE/TadG family type IV pilus assembly protein n=1 Tax=Vibrio sp. V30_P3S12P165 TaxID=1938682 RepID=UPI0013723CC9|nr:TadE/TadG family type IV pilus assembly protein [Vibrio sp. V30_P3S12P165]NAX04086.1 TadG [Vibrio sp. V30_P3S12P165]